MRIAVVGAGIAGLLIARTLAKYGYRIDIYEEDQRVGFPKHCTGLISRWVVDKIGVPAFNSVEDQYRLYKFFINDKDVFDIMIKQEVFRVDRVQLENLLFKELSRFPNVEFSFGNKITKISHINSQKILLNDGKDHQYYDILIIFNYC